MSTVISPLDIKRTHSTELRFKHNVNSPRAQGREQTAAQELPNISQERKNVNSPRSNQKNEPQQEEEETGLQSLVTQAQRITFKSERENSHSVALDKQNDPFYRAVKKDLEDKVSESEARTFKLPENLGLLGRPKKEHHGKKCLVLDLDETLVHSSFKRVAGADFIVPIEIEGVIHRAYVLKRPYADEFLWECSKHYEIVLFTASLSKYADPLLDMLDTKKTMHHRLFRDSCVRQGHTYIKDLTQLGRRIEDIIFIDNSPQSYMFQPNNAIPIPTWYDDMSDTALRDLIPLLQKMANIRDVRKILGSHLANFQSLCRLGKI